MFNDPQLTEIVAASARERAISAASARERAMALVLNEREAEEATGRRDLERRPEEKIHR